MRTNPFNCKKPEVQTIQLNNPYIVRAVSMKADAETLSAVPVFEKVNYQEEIQASVELCGMEYMKKLLASGQISASDLEDNAGQDYDLRQIPETIHEANRLANEANEELQRAAQFAGAEEGEKYSAKQLEDMVTKAVKQAFEASQAAKATPSNEGE